MKGKLQLTCVLISLLLSFLSYAQQPLRFKQLADKDGLSSNQVTCFAQNSHGLMWIGTVNGLNSYDGFRFRNFFHSAWDSSSIADSYIQCLLSDHEDRIWAGGRGSVSMLTNGGVKFVVWTIPQSKKVFCLYEDAQNRVWAGCDNGLYVFNTSGNKFDKVLNEPVYDIDFKNPFLALTSRSAIYGFDPVKNNIIGNYTEQFMGLGGMVYQPSTLTADHDQLFITNSYTGFYVANTRTEQYLKIDPFGGQIFTPVCHKADSSGNIWVGCTKGLYTYNQADSSLKKANEFALADETLLGSQHILCLFFDQSGLLWAGTREQGIFIAGTLKNMFLPYQLPNFKNKRITAIRTTSRDVLVGTESNGLISWMYPSEVTIAQTNLPATKINCITSTTDPDLYWIGTDKGLFAWERSSNTFTLHKLYTDTLSQEITSIAEVKDQNVWIGTTFGLIRYIPSAKDVFIYAHKPNQASSISAGRVNVAYHDKHDRIWTGTQSGLDLYVANGSYFEHYGSTLNVINPDISSVSEDKSGNLLIAVSNAGFIILNTQNRKASTIIPDIFCQSVLVDPSNAAWLGTIGGLIKINSSGQFRNYTVEEGLTAVEHIAGSINWLPDQNAAIGTSSGLYILNTKYKTPDAGRFNFILSNILLDGKPGAWKNNSIELKPETKYLSIQFGTNDYADPTAHTIQYVVEGLDKEWKSCPLGEVHLSNLDEGTYTLKVGELKEGKIINEQKLLSIKVIPPFWNSFAFHILIMVLALGLLWWAIAFYLKHMKKAEAEKHELDKRSMRLELDAYKSQIDSQYFANIIYAIQDCIDNNDLQNARSYLSKFSSLISCLVEFADLEFISVDQLWKVLEYYLSIEKMRLAGQLEYRIDIAPEIIDRMKTMVPNMIVQPYVENAVNLGLKQKIKERKILVRFDPWSKQHVLCTIEDNGIGRKVAARMRSARMDFHRTSHTRVAEEKMQLLEKTHKLETRLEVIDLIDDSGESNGTKVILHLPLQF